MRAARRISFEDVRLSLWFMPSLAALVSLVAAIGLAEVTPSEGSWLAELPWPGDYDTATRVLQVVSTSIITVTSLTFSLVVVALQLASQQFSPRLLREFARDWLIQAVLAVLVSTFVFTLTVLLRLRADEPVPKTAVLIGYGLGLLSIAALLAFLGHLVKALRIDTLMVSVHGETVSTIETSYPSVAEPEPARPDGLPDPSTGTLVPSVRSGFVKVIRPAPLVALAAREDVVLQMGIRPGDHVVVGTPLAAVARRDGTPLDQHAADLLAEPVLAGVELGYERTSEQDAALGLRQLTDIAVKALSPGINDPVTAAHALGYASDLLVRLHGRHLGPQAHADAEGRARVVLPDRDERYYLDLVCDQVRRYGRREPTALIALLRMLRDVAVAVRSPQQAAEVRRQVRLILTEMSGELQPEDTAEVRSVADRVEQALQGDVAAAYADRSGETRSL